VALGDRFAIVLVLLLGSAKLPEAARSLGRSLRILNTELRADDTQSVEQNLPGDSPAGRA
jgi:Sec-independent protein translocase protein TatA